MAKIKKNSINPKKSVQDKSKSKYNKISGTTGLNNLGNTCFMNSALQCLSNIPEFRDYFLSSDFAHLDNVEKSLSKNLADLMKNLWNNETKSSISPFKLRKCVISYENMYNNFDQNDSHEFLNHLLNILHEELKINEPDDTFKLKPISLDYKNWKKEILKYGSDLWNEYINSYRSIVSELFHSFVYEKMTCLECNQLTVKFDVLNGLVLPIPEARNLSKRKHDDLIPNLRDCLNENFKVVCNNEANNYCGHCCKKTKYEEQIQLFNLPKIFIIQLNRFKFDFDFKKIKNDQAIDFFQELNLSKYATDGQEYPLYELISISKHIGSASFGHYNTWAKNDKSDNWFVFDDSIVSRVDPSIFKLNLRENAYFLVYARQRKCDTFSKNTSIDESDMEKNENRRKKSRFFERFKSFSHPRKLIINFLECIFLFYFVLL